MMIGRLPEDGTLQLGSVTLPSGRQVMARYGSGQPVAWATDAKLPDPGRVWAALSDIQPHTGLVPILLSSLRGEPKRPWDDGEFEDPEDTSVLDYSDAERLLKAAWTGGIGELGEAEEEDPDLIADRAPFGRRFPGLAPPGDSALSPAQVQEALGSLRPARIGLVTAARPADVLPRIGWTGATNRYETPLPIAGVLRSWEDRFGARLLEVGMADIRLLVQRPPHTLEQAERVAAEQYGFADEFGRVPRSIPKLAASLVNAPIWTFWWD